MRARWLGIWAPALLLFAACSAEGGSSAGRGDGGRDARSGGDGGGGGHDSSVVCTDGDGDGIADNLESTSDTDMDGIPASQDDDSDGDGFLDADEAIRNYAGFPTSSPPLTCGQTPDDCDADGIINSLDTDSDNDGLTDAEEREANTNPCTEDTDGDGVPDLTERAAGSDPTMSASTPPTSALYVTLPYHPPGEAGAHETREFTFATRIRAADIFFVVDTTGSMSATIAQVQSTLSSTIIPGIVSALGAGADVRYGVAGHGDFQEGGSNYTGAVQVFQRLTPDPMAAQRATMSLRADNGGDYPEAQVPAMHALITGHGEATYAGTATRDVDPPRDCGSGPDDVGAYGWGCFLPGRVPIMVLFSDAQWHNAPGDGNFYTSTPGAGTYNSLRDEMVRRGAYFVGIDVGGGDTYTRSGTLATDTGTLDGSGMPIRFRGTASSVASSVVTAITQIAGSTRQNITTRTDADTTEMPLMAPHTTADFIKAVTPARGIPDAPTGYDRHDDTTFYNVAPSTSVVFSVDFYNDFQPGGRTAQLYRATIVVLGRASSAVDSREVYIIVPAEGGGEPG